MDMPENVRKKILEGLRTHTAVAPEGSVICLPLAKGKRPGYGAAIEWDLRVHKRGVAGPLEFGREALQAIRAPDDWYDAGLKARALLEERTLPVAKPLKPIEVPAGAE